MAGCSRRGRRLQWCGDGKGSRLRHGMACRARHAAAPFPGLPFVARLGMRVEAVLDAPEASFALECGHALLVGRQPAQIHSKPREPNSQAWAGLRELY